MGIKYPSLKLHYDAHGKYARFPDIYPLPSIVHPKRT